MFIQWFLIRAYSFWLNWAVWLSASIALREISKWHQKCWSAVVLLSACCSHFSSKAGQCSGMTIAELCLVFGFPALTKASRQAEKWSLGVLGLRLKEKVCIPLLVLGQPMGWSYLFKREDTACWECLADNFMSELMKESLSREDLQQDLFKQFLLWFSSPKYFLSFFPCPVTESLGLGITSG